MIADENCLMPNSLKFEADQRFFESELARVDVVAHGRKSHEGMESSASRRRLLMTRSVASLAPEPSAPNAFLWNPGRGFAGERLRSVFGLPSASSRSPAERPPTISFSIATTKFTFAARARCDYLAVRRFSRAWTQGRSPADVLRSHGLEPEPARTLDRDPRRNLRPLEREGPTRQPISARGRARCRASGAVGDRIRR